MWKTEYFNGWTEKAIWDYCKENVNNRLVYNTEHGSRREMPNGDIYETRMITAENGMDYITEIYINGALVQASRSA